MVVDYFAFTHELYSVFLPCFGAEFWGGK